ncbi:HAD hydrolase-like protein [bacterium]|nr:HAD hydrolase-like protein [bacterium]
MITSFANILFDLDGTLTDPKVGITRSIQYALEQLNEPVPAADELTWCIGPPLLDFFATILNSRDDARLNQALTHYRKRFADVGLFENTVYPDCEDSLQKIKIAGFKIFLATSKPGVFAKKILDHFNLSRFFDGIYGSELDGRRSDKGELIAHILATEKLDSGDTLMVGDRCHDIIGGKKNSLRTAAVSYGYGSREEISSSDPDMIFDSMTQLASFLQSQNIPAE